MATTTNDLAAAVRALWTTTPPVARRPGSPDELTGGATGPTPPTLEGLATGPTTGSTIEAEPTEPPAAPPPPVVHSKPIPSKPATQPTLSAGQPLAERCPHHGDRRRWLDRPAANRPGWIRTTCGFCGGFVGYRPSTAD